MMDEAIDAKRIARVARCFDATGRLQRWPSRRADQLLVLRVVWSYLPSDVQMSEPEVSSMLRDWHDYEDYALLRRELCDLDMMRRTPNGRVYRRVEHDMPAEAQILAERFTPIRITGADASWTNDQAIGQTEMIGKASQQT